MKKSDPPELRLLGQDQVCNDGHHVRCSFEDEEQKRIKKNRVKKPITTFHTLHPKNARRRQFTNEVKSSVRGVAMLGEVVWIELFKGLVSLNFVCPLGVVVVGDFLVQFLDGHGFVYVCCLICVGCEKRMAKGEEWKVES